MWGILCYILVSYRNIPCHTVFALQYQEYIPKPGRDGAGINIELIDTMGMAKSGGILTEDITTVLDGSVRNTDTVS